MTRPTAWSIWYATLLHWVWGITLLSSFAPLGITAIATVVQLGLASAYGVGALYILVTVMAVLGLFAPRSVGRILFLPQHAMMLISAWGASRAMWFGVFADGTVRSSAFLIADQAPHLLILPFYIGAIYYTLYRSAPSTVPSLPTNF